MKKLIPLFLLIASVAWAAPPSGRFNNVTVDNGLTLGGERFTAWPTVGVPDNLALLRGDNGAIRGFYAIGNPDFTDNLTVYGKDVTGDNTGRVQGFSIGSSSYTDNGYFADLITGGPWVDVRKYGTALTGVPIQAALSAIDNSIGADIFIPRGQYEIGTGLLLQNKSNVTIGGDGVDSTILHMNLGTATKPSVYNTYTWGILSIESNSALDTNVSNIVIKDMTFWLDNTGTPGSLSADMADGTYYIKNVYFRGVSNITFKNIKIRGSRWEALYTDGNSSSPPTKIKVLDSYFLDTQHNGFDTNTANADEVIVEGCFFDNVLSGIQTVGNRVSIQGNIFKNPRNYAIQFTEQNGYPAATTDTSHVIISGNIITGLGTGATATKNVYGIAGNGGDSQATDNTIDHGIIISNNTINNSYKESTNAGPLTAFQLVGGNMKVSNNHVSGLTKEAGATGNAVAYNITKGTTSGIAKQQVYFNNNTLDNTLYGNTWDIGISINGGDNSYYYLSNSVITGSHSTEVVDGLNVTGTGYVSLNGDIINGWIYYAGKWEDPVYVYVNYSGLLDNVPLYGDSNGSLGTFYSKDLTRKTFTDNATTPSVAKRNILFTANTGATTITNFTGGMNGQEITILFTDNVTTVQNNSNILLSGATNFVATPNDVLRLLYFPGTGWREVGRSVN